MTVSPSDITRPNLGGSPEWMSILEVDRTETVDPTKNYPDDYTPQDDRLKEASITVRRVLTYHGSDYLDGKYEHNFSLAMLGLVLSRYVNYGATSSPDEPYTYLTGMYPERVFGGDSEVHLQKNIGGNLAEPDNAYAPFDMRPTKERFGCIGSPVPEKENERLKQSVEQFDEFETGTSTPENFVQGNFENEAEGSAIAKVIKTGIPVAIGAASSIVGSTALGLALSATNYLITAAGLARSLQRGSSEEDRYVHPDPESINTYRTGLIMNGYYTGVFHALEFTVHARPRDRFTFTLESKYEATDGGRGSKEMFAYTPVGGIAEEHSTATFDVEIPGNPLNPSQGPGPVVVENPPRVESKSVG